jgi:hypothetical protein
MKRFSIKTLMVVIGLIAVAIAVLRNPSQLAASLTYTLAFASLVVAGVNAICYGWGTHRAYCLGFLVCGGAYFAASAIPTLRENLATEAVFDLAFLSLNPAVPFVPPGPASMMPTAISGLPLGVAGIGGGTAPLGSQPDSRWEFWTERDPMIDGSAGHIVLASSPAFRVVGHSVVTLFVAVFGGAYARRRYQAWADREQAAR